MSIDTSRAPDPPSSARTALLLLIERLPEEAVVRLWRVVWWWVRGPGEPPAHYR